MQAKKIDFYYGIKSYKFLLMPILSLFLLLINQREIFIVTMKIAIFPHIYIYWKRNKEAKIDIQILENLMAGNKSERIKVFFILIFIYLISTLTYFLNDKDPSYCQGCTSTSIGLIVYHFLIHITLMGISLLLLTFFKHRKIIFNIN